MKRTLAILFAALLVLSLAACGGNAGNGDATEPAVSGDETAQSDETVSAAPSEATTGSAPAAQTALLPGDLVQLDDAAAPVIRGLRLAGNLAGEDAFNAKDPAATGVRCIFELNEWVDVYPDTDAESGLAVWVFRHTDDADAYKDAKLSEEFPGFVAFCELQTDAEDAAGSFYLNPEDAEAGYYDLVFTLDGKPTALLLTRFYNERELEGKTDAELEQLMNGLR